MPRQGLDFHKWSACLHHFRQRYECCIYKHYPLGGCKDLAYLQEMATKRHWQHTWQDTRHTTHGIRDTTHNTPHTTYGTRHATRHDTWRRNHDVTTSRIC
jgi:hypothetical protein